MPLQGGALSQPVAQPFLLVLNSVSGQRSASRSLAVSTSLKMPNSTAGKRAVQLWPVCSSSEAAEARLALDNSQSRIVGLR